MISPLQGKELFSLRIGDVYTRSGEVRDVIRFRDKKQRHVESCKLSLEAKNALAEYKEKRPELLQDHDGWLLPSRS